MRYLFTILLFMLTWCVTAQPDEETGRFQLPIENSEEVRAETDFFKLYTSAATGELADNSEKAFRVALELQRIAIKKEKPELTFLADYFLGRCYYFFNNGEKAVRSFSLANQIAIKHNWYTEQVKINLYLASVFQLKRNYKQAEQYFLKALSLAETKTVEPGVQLEVYEKLGYMYLLEDVDNLTNSRKFYNKGLELAQREKDTGQLGVFITKLAELDLVQGKKGNGIENMRRGISYIRRKGSKEDLVVALKGFGDMYYNLHQNDSAQYYYIKCYQMRKGMGQHRVTAITACDVAYMYGLNGQHKLLDQFADTALKYVRLDKTGDAKFYVFKWLADIYSITKNKDRSIQLYKSYAKVLDSTIKNTTDAALARQGLQMDFDNQLGKLKEEQEREKEIRRKEKEHAQFLSRIYLVGFLIVLVFSIIIFREFRRNKKQKRIIEKQNLEVIEKSNIIEVKNKEMTDSINYAQRIQAGLLSSKQDLFDIFPGSFLYYNPKDILSGDFYWFCKKQNTVYVACGDCTGHGVPGALMSVLGINLLNDIVEGKNVTAPAQILGQLRTAIIRSLNKDMNSGEYKDGMDIALLRIDLDNGQCTYAGANNPVYHIKGDTLEAYQANKHPVGYAAVLKPFDEQVFHVKKGDLLVLFTDGFPDQFGGPSNKKLMYKPFRELVMGVVTTNISNPEEEFHHRFTTWRGKNEQIDDVCVMGIKI